MEKGLPSGLFLGLPTERELMRIRLQQLHFLCQRNILYRSAQFIGNGNPESVVYLVNDQGTQRLDVYVARFRTSKARQRQVRFDPLEERFDGPPLGIARYP